MAGARSTVFIGSSAEGLQIAEAMQLNLDHFCETEIWSQGVFGLSGNTLESLVEAALRFDFAIIVITPDDMTSSRSRVQQAPRDNILLEIGLFIGTLGRKRTFVVYDRTANVKIPTDLAGVTLAGFQPNSSGNAAAALGPSCTRIKAAISELGRFIRLGAVSEERLPTVQDGRQEIRPGDAVQLRSGGVKMTVEDIGASRRDDSKVVARCAYFGEGMHGGPYLHHDEFSLAMLVIVERAGSAAAPDPKRF
jgi:uncharacterized protein YodC (DUF2158 family)